MANENLEASLANVEFSPYFNEVMSAELSPQFLSAYSKRLLMPQEAAEQPKYSS